MLRTPPKTRRAIVSALTALSLLAAGAVGATASEPASYAPRPNDAIDIADRTIGPIRPPVEDWHATYGIKREQYKPSKKIKRVAGLKHVKSYLDGARIQFKWVKGVTKYELEFSTSKKFEKVYLHVVENPRKKPSAGKLSTRVRGLWSGTKYYVRARAIKGDKAGKWSKVAKFKTTTTWIIIGT